MGKRKKKPHPNLMREHVLTLVALFDGYFTLTKVPSPVLQKRIAVLQADLQDLICSELDVFPVKEKTIKPKAIQLSLPTDQVSFDESRVDWRNATSPLHEFMDASGKYAATIDESELSTSDRTKCHAVKQRVDDVLRQPEEADLEVMRKASESRTPINQDEIASLHRLTRCFDRPAFYTSFFMEASLPDFRQAITDTIEAVNTGIRRLRDGTVIERCISRHGFTDPTTRRRLEKIERMVVNIRAKFDAFLRNGQIQQRLAPGSPIQSYLAEPEVCRTMDEQRASVLDAVRRLLPTFSVSLERDASREAFLPIHVDDSGHVRIGAELIQVPAEEIRWSEPMTKTQLSKVFRKNTKTIVSWIKMPDGNGIQWDQVGRRYRVPLNQIPLQDP